MDNSDKYLKGAGMGRSLLSRAVRHDSRQKNATVGLNLENRGQRMRRAAGGVQRVEKLAVHGHGGVSSGWADGC